MRFHKEIVFPGRLDDVAELLADEKFRRAVAERAGAHDVDATRTEEDGVVVATVDSRQPADGLPGVAKKFIGSELHIRQVERWTSHDHADLDVTVPGTPLHVRGTVTLEQRGAETVQAVDAEIKVRVPLIGGQIETMIGRVLGHVLKLQAVVGAEHLAER
ncbi:MAG: DUF2505 domain-containing protein [Baekduia sp.]